MFGFIHSLLFHRLVHSFDVFALTLPSVESMWFFTRKYRYDAIILSSVGVTRGGIGCPACPFVFWDGGLCGFRDSDIISTALFGIPILVKM